MSDRPDEATPRIHVDDDWKTEAAREKAKLVEETTDVDAQGPLPAPRFPELINMIAMQAVVGLGGMTTPDGQHIPPDMELAKHQIDMLELLVIKTKGNLEAEESKLLDTVLYELRMRFVQAVGGVPAGGPAGPQHEPAS